MNFFSVFCITYILVGLDADAPVTFNNADLVYNQLKYIQVISDKNPWTCANMLEGIHWFHFGMETSVTSVNFKAKSEFQRMTVETWPNAVTCKNSNYQPNKNVLFTCPSNSLNSWIGITKNPSDKIELCEYGIYVAGSSTPTAGTYSTNYPVSTIKTDNTGIDKNYWTCIKDFPIVDYYKITFSGPMTVGRVRLTAKTELKNVKVSLHDSKGQMLRDCNSITKISNHQSEFSCGTTYNVKSVQIQNTALTISEQDELCEVEAYNQPAVPCQLPPQVSNGKWSNTATNSNIQESEFAVGTSLGLVCNNGFKVKGSNNLIECEYGGTWSATDNLASCIKILCKLPESPMFGQWINSDTKEPPAKETLETSMNLELECNYGYTPSEAEATITCLHNTSWSKSNLLCVAKPCQVPPSYPDGKWINPITKSSGGIEFAVGTSLELECDNGFKVVSTSSDKIKCVQGGFWAITDNIPGCKSSCESSSLINNQSMGESAIGKYATLNFRKVPNRRGIDQSNSTCVEDFTLADGYLIQMKPSTAVDTVRISSKSAFKELEVSLQDDNYGLYRCDTIQEISDRQTDFICQTNNKMKSIQIRKKPLIIYEEDDLCEIQIFYQSNDLTLHITDAYLYFDPKNDENGIDHDLSTCVESFPRTRTYTVSLKKPVTVTAVRLTGRSDVKDIKIILLDNAWKETKCEKEFIRNDKQVTISCPRNYETEHVMLKNTAGSISNQTELCEVEIFVKSDKK